MENATKALIMVANLMLAVMVLSVIVYFYQNMKALPQEQETARMIEETRKFNLEYEVFDKNLMYGVDVISALNKAASNNEKYVLGKFLSGSKSGQEFIIDIVVVLKSTEPLADTITVNYLDNNSADTELVKERAYATGQGPGGIRFKDLKPRLILPDNTYPEVLYGPSITDMGETKLLTNRIETNIGAGTYHLLDTSKFKANGDYTKESITSDTPLKVLISMTDSMSQYIKNTDPTQDKRKTTDVNAEGGYWSSMEWKTALYDLKTRKFRCAELDASGNAKGTGIHYNTTTGVIDRIQFVEI